MANSNKFCNTCSVSKPLEAFGNNKRLKSGIENICRACKAAKFAAWRLKNLDTRTASQKAWYDANPGAKSRHDAKYAAKHMPEIAARATQWRIANLERARAGVRRRSRINAAQIAEYRATAHYVAMKKAADARWRRANVERAAHNSREWRRNNPERYRASTSRRKALMRDAPGFATIDQVQARVDYYGGRCWMCGADWESIDHVKPLSKGGSNWPSNLRPACISCNSSKRAVWPFPTSTLRLAA